MNINDIITQVRYIINEAVTCPDDFTVETDASIENFIRSAMVQIASSPTYSGTPTALVDKSNVIFSPRPDGLVYAVISPPGDFLRPVSVFLEGWAHPVYTFLSVHSYMFVGQYSSAPGVGNGPAKPAAFLSKDNKASVIAHAVTTEGAYELRYISVPSITEDGTVVMPDKYSECLAYTAAALYLQSVNEYDSAKAAFDTAGAFLQTINIETIETNA